MIRAGIKPEIVMLIAKILCTTAIDLALRTTLVWPVTDNRNPELSKVLLYADDILIISENRMQTPERIRNASEAKLVLRKANGGTDWVNPGSQKRLSSEGNRRNFARN